MINGQQSEWANIHAGVPQGSVLGSMLFLLYINDLVGAVSRCQIRMFADDTCLFIDNTNRVLAQESLDSDLADIHSWANRWLVNFSPAKTKAMLISNKRDRDAIPDITYQGNSIQNVSSINILVFIYHGTLNGPSISIIYEMPHVKSCVRLNI